MENLSDRIKAVQLLIKIVTMLIVYFKLSKTIKKYIDAMILK